MSKQVPVRGSRSRGKSKSRAVAGASEIRIAEEASANSTNVTAPSARQERLWGRARRSAAQHARCRNEHQWTVTDDLPEPLPVTAAELDVIETYLGDLLNDLLSCRRVA